MPARNTYFGSMNNILSNCDVNSAKLKDLKFTTKPPAEGGSMQMLKIR